MDVLESATVTLIVTETAFPARVVIVKQLTAEAILGVDILAENGSTVQVGKNILDFGVSSPLIHSNRKYVLPPTGVFLVETVRIAAFCEMEMMATTQTSVSECNCINIIPYGTYNIYDNWILTGEQRDKKGTIGGCPCCCQSC